MKLNVFVLLNLFLIKQAQAFVLPEPQPIKGYHCIHCSILPQEPVSLSWSINAGAPLHHDTLHQQASRKYLLKVSLKQLQEGVAIFTQAPGAIIRISPLDPQQKNIPELRIQGPKGTLQKLPEASVLFSQENNLQKAVFTDTSFLLAVLKPQLHFGKFILSTPENLNLGKKEGESLLIVSVFDANSTIELSIKTDKAAYQYGEELKAKIALNKGNIDNLDVFLITPERQKIPVKAELISSNRAQIRFSLLCDKNSFGENWDIEVVASASFMDQAISRQAHT